MGAKLAKDLARNGSYGINESGAPGKGTATGAQEQPAELTVEQALIAAAGSQTAPEHTSGFSREEFGARYQATAPPVDVFLRLDDVKRVTGLGRSTIYDLMAAGFFPRAVKIGNGKAIAWSASEIGQWQRARMAARGAPR